MRYALILLFFISGNALAQEQQRIPDMSLSIEDTFKQPSSSDTQRGINQQAPGYPAYDAGARDANGLAPIIGALPANTFMDGYCDPNFRPGLASSGKYAGMQECLQQQRQNVCAQFNALPADTKQPLDSTIGCLFNAQNGDAENAAAGCNAGDSQRLQLVKKYWQDQNTAYALLFLPDEVLNSGRCRPER